MTAEHHTDLTRLIAEHRPVQIGIRDLVQCSSCGDETTYTPDRAWASHLAAVIEAAGWRQVEATARVGASSRPLRDAAAWLVDTGWPFDWRSDIPMPHALAEVVIDHIHADPTGGLHGNRLDRDEVEDWIANEAGHRWRAQAKVVEDGGGDD